MFSMYHRSQEVEMQENPSQLALIMVPTVQSKQGNNLFRHYNIVNMLYMFSIAFLLWVK